MSLRLEMLQVARLAPQLLSDATDLVREFVISHQHSDGGFCDRSGDPDLYYSVFGLGCMMALDMPLDEGREASYLRRFDAGEDLDLIHFSALCRCWSAIGGPDKALRQRLEDRLASFKAGDGGYHVTPGAPMGNPYGNFMALGAMQDLEIEPPDVNALVAGCLAHGAKDGGLANDLNLPMGNVPAVAASEAVLRNLGTTLPGVHGDWLERQAYGEGGFFAVPQAPMPDLLSTATALHALRGMDRDLEPYREACLDFIDSLWVNKGSFYGSWGETYLDCEYTFYGLLALGHLSL